jgi:amino acid transporter
MTGKTFAFATIASAVVSFLLGYLIYGMAMVNFFESNTTPEGLAVMMAEPNLLGIFLGSLVYGALFTLVLGSWAKVSSVAEGVKAGTIVGLLIALSFNLFFYSSTNTSTLTAHLVDSALGGVMGGVMGAVIAAVVGKTSASA